MLLQLNELRATLLKQQEAAQAKSDPAAFVTFKWASPSLGSTAFLLLLFLQSLTLCPMLLFSLAFSQLPLPVTMMMSTVVVAFLVVRRCFCLSAMDSPLLFLSADGAQGWAGL